VLAASTSLRAQATGTFIDRELSTDLRIISYNIFNDTIFPETSVTQAAKFSRLITALNPDVVNLQEIYTHTATDVVDLMNQILPLSAGATWYAQQGHDNVIVSRFPLLLGQTNTEPLSPRGIAIALVDLPDIQFETNFYLMNNHFRCCGGANGPENNERQRQADSLISWMRDSRTAGGMVNLAPGTPMAVVGDLNMVGSLEPLNTLLGGSILHEDAYGVDSPPDWDGTHLVDVRPLHNVDGPDDYTMRNGQSRSRLDFILYTDSVATIGKKFVLNTVAMSAADLAATGLEKYDVTLDTVGIEYDHLPLIVDFRPDGSAMDGDYNFDERLNALDYGLWRAHFGSNFPATDGNDNGIVDAADYVLWRKRHAENEVSGISATVPEPASWLFLFISVMILPCIVGGRMRSHCQNRVIASEDNLWTNKK
jgi:endonuclease/exonuclease/phosphatase family metal-dependent hydrolase